ncbi:hypothetical protein PTTG_02213, partial [Puccinia triticina 1-1 BBBD Race 1]
MNSRTPLRPVIQLLGSPPHLIFQLVRLTTLPYMIYQIINNNNKQNEQPLEQQIDQLEHSPQLSPQAVDQLFLINRAAILNTLRPQHHHPQPHTPTSTAWQAEAMAQIVQHWTTLKQQQHHHPATSSISKSRKIHSHIRAFLANGPPQCHCQRSQLPLKTIHLGLHQVGTLQSSATLGRFASKLNHALSPLTILRLVDLARHAQRWDLAVIFLDRSLAEPAITSDPRLANRRSGQVTALLHFLRRHQPPPEPELDPLKLWAIHFICQSIESRIISPPHPQWAPINRLSLDVLTRYASMPIGFDRRLKKHQKTTPQTYPCLDLTRHRILLDAINQSTSELEFAVLTRERCERLLSKLTRLTIQQPASSQPWTRRSALQLRLLEYLARQGTHQQFTTLLHTHLHQHPSTPKLARTILLAARRFDSLAANPELIRHTLSQLDQEADQRPVIDFLLRPRQPLDTLRANLAICLASLPTERDRRMAIYTHLLFRCSQLPSPSLALSLWETINRDERRRSLIKLGRRTRAKLKHLLSATHPTKTDPLAITLSPDTLPHQTIRSMIYVYRNLTHAPKSALPVPPATGKHYRAMYQRLALKGSHRARWPLSRAQARTHLVLHLLKTELRRLPPGKPSSEYAILRA